MSTHDFTDNDPTASYPAVDGAAPAAPAAPLTTAAGDRCANCGAALASDQRYCVTCGERRGRARFDAAALGRGTLPAAQEPAAGWGPPPEGRINRWTNSTTLVAFVATLLVAIALGVLIGHDSSNKTQTVSAGSASTPNIVVNAGGSGAATSGTTAATSGATVSSKGTGKVPKTAKAKAAATAKANQRAAAQQSKILGGSGAAKLAAPTTKVGGSCKKGTHGCSSSGKFTGNFFGGG